jgi:hypothetical protein
VTLRPNVGGVLEIGRCDGPPVPTTQTSRTILPPSVCRQCFRRDGPV